MEEVNTQEEMFICRDCKDEFPVSKSVKDGSRPRGIMERCKPCQKTRQDAIRADPVKGETQRGRVRVAMQARRQADREDGLSLSSYRGLTEAQLEARRVYAREHKHQQTLARLGATEEDYWDQLAQQGGKCAICPRTEPGFGRKYWAWDHNHKTNKRRGLLCIPCNLGIAHFDESEETMLAAIAYLEHWLAA